MDPHFVGPFSSNPQTSVSWGSAFGLRRLLAIASTDQVTLPATRVLPPFPVHTAPTPTLTSHSRTWGRWVFIPRYASEITTKIFLSHHFFHDKPPWPPFFPALASGYPTRSCDPDPSPPLMKNQRGFSPMNSAYHTLHLDPPTSFITRFQFPGSASPYPTSRLVDDLIVAPPLDVLPLVPRSYKSFPPG